jgi:hypothetical protein
MSDGQLRVRIRAAEREENWAPRYVGNELAGTHQAADAQRRTAALRAAEAEASDEPDPLLLQSREAGALAEVLDRRAVELQEIDDARARWLAHTAATRAAGERAQAEFAIRHAGEEPEPVVTAEEWLAAHRADQADEDRHREITEEYELDAAPLGPSRPDADIREQDRADDPAVDADETAAAIAQAHRALAEIEAREAYDAQQEEVIRSQPATDLDLADDDVLERL